MLNPGWQKRLINDNGMYYISDVIYTPDDAETPIDVDDFDESGFGQQYTAHSVKELRDKLHDMISDAFSNPEIVRQLNGSWKEA